MAKKKGLFTVLKRIFISEANSEKVKTKKLILIVSGFLHLVWLFLCISAEREEKKMDILEA